MDLSGVFQRLHRAIALRKKYTPCAVDPPDEAFAPKLPPVSDLKFEFRSGLARVSRASDGACLIEPTADVEEFYKDMADFYAIRTDGSVCTFCFQRLRLLQTKFELYMMANFDLEMQEQMSVSHRDFYNVRKVDTHIHHSAAMNAKHLLRFIKKKAKTCGSDVVLRRQGEPVTLDQLFRELGLTPYDLSLDHMNVTADQTVFNRFDRFNQKYNPLNQPDLRTVFLKTDNEMQGSYLAEITRELLDDLEESKFQHAEWRLSIYGRKRDEWRQLSRWVLSYKLVSPNNLWMIQIPRLYSVYRASGQLSCFQDMLDNIFVPMFEATLDPQAHPEVAEFMSLVSGFDSVDDESKSNEPGDRTTSSLARTPEEWTLHANPSYKYYNFYLQSNLRVLNRLRASLGFNQFAYRPHAGEAGELHHLDAAFLLADGIAHGLNLRKSMSLQYLYYLCGIGIAMSPCSNNNLFLSYQKTPFHDFFVRGLNVSLSTDDPLMFHQTKEPLMEEYSLAKQFFRLSSADLCELARNSVLQSGFSRDTKASWLGSADPTVNDMLKTNCPTSRLKYRKECLAEEMFLLNHAVDDVMKAYRAGIPQTLPQRRPSPLLLPLSQRAAAEAVAQDENLNADIPRNPASQHASPRLAASQHVSPRLPSSQHVSPAMCPTSLRMPNILPETAEDIERLDIPPLSPSEVTASSPKRARTGDLSPRAECKQGTR
mmetsp:Transcript_33130/g.95239  ORF Transcript_33130/g.95239 Transcript_33130/m.95239 type:complete len:709 (+) Transcript_33130:3-2129(+)